MSNILMLKNKTFLLIGLEIKKNKINESGIKIPIIRVAQVSAEKIDNNIKFLKFSLSIVLKKKYILTVTKDKKIISLLL